MSENTIHYSDCQLPDGPAHISRVCSCGADPLAGPISYGSEFPSKQAEEGYRAGFIDGRRQVASTLPSATSALETAIGLLEGFAKDVSACEYLEHSVGGKPTVLDDLRAALTASSDREAVAKEDWIKQEREEFERAFFASNLTTARYGAALILREGDSYRTVRMAEAWNGWQLARLADQQKARASSEASR